MDSILNYSDDEEEDTLIGHIAPETTPLCQICNTHESKYKCPKCGMKTCSLACCKQHKADNCCDGKRDKASFVGIKEFNENNLRNDYHFLENVLGSKKSAERIVVNTFGGEKALATKAYTSSFEKSNLDMHSKSAKKLVSMCKKFQCSLLLMPQGMSKRKRNKSMVSFKTRQIHWHIELVFVINDCYKISQVNQLDFTKDVDVIIQEGLVGHSLSDINEFITIQDIFSRCIENRPDNSILRHALSSLRKNVSQVKCLIQKLPSNASNPSFFEIPMEFTLHQALQGKTVIEFPTLFFGVEEHLTLFKRDIMESKSFLSSSSSLPSTPPTSICEKNSLDTNRSLTSCSSSQVSHPTKVGNTNHKIQLKFVRKEDNPTDNENNNDKLDDGANDAPRELLKIISSRRKRKDRDNSGALSDEYQDVLPCKRSRQLEEGEISSCSESSEESEVSDIVMTTVDEEEEHDEDPLTVAYDNINDNDINNTTSDTTIHETRRASQTFHHNKPGLSMATPTTTSTTATTINTTTIMTTNTTTISEDEESDDEQPNYWTSSALDEDNDKLSLDDPDISKNPEFLKAFSEFVNQDLDALRNFITQSEQELEIDSEE